MDKLDFKDYGQSPKTHISNTKIEAGTNKIRIIVNIVSVLGQEEGYTVKYTPPPEGVPEGEARGNS